MISEKLRTEYQYYSQSDINLSFLTACLNGELDKVKYLLTSTELKFNADIHIDKEMGLRSTCMNGNLEIVRFLTSSSDLKEHADLGYDHGTPLIVAAANNHLEIVQYFLEFPILKNYEDRAFLAACEKNNLDIAAYFIYERSIKDLTKSNVFRSRIPCIREIDKMFSKRELKESLEFELSSSSNKSNRIKL